MSKALGMELALDIAKNAGPEYWVLYEKTGRSYQWRGNDLYRRFPGGREALVEDEDSRAYILREYLGTIHRLGSTLSGNAILLWAIKNPMKEFLWGSFRQRLNPEVGMEYYDGAWFPDNSFDTRDTYTTTEQVMVPVDFEVVPK
jgi:hypothetical protein